jgi:hypothetical protein
VTDQERDEVRREAIQECLRLVCAERDRLLLVAEQANDGPFKDVVNLKCCGCNSVEQIIRRLLDQPPPAREAEE